MKLLALALGATAVGATTSLRSNRFQDESQGVIEAADASAESVSSASASEVEAETTAEVGGMDLVIKGCKKKPISSAPGRATSPGPRA